MATRSQLGATTQMQPSPSSLPPTASAPRPLRVSQQDSLELDDALSNMLTEGVSTSLDNFNVSPSHPSLSLARGELLTRRFLDSTDNNSPTSRSSFSRSSTSS